MATFPIGLMILLGVFCLAIGTLLLIAAVTSGPKKLETDPRKARPNNRSRDERAFSGKPAP